MPKTPETSQGRTAPQTATEDVTTVRARLQRLEASLWVTLDAADVAVKAQVAGQLRQVIKDLAALGEPATEVSIADEIAARRHARRTAAADRKGAGSRSQPRRSSGGHRTG